MEIPFPGMDPYLEKANIWPDVHHRMISTLCDQIASQLNPRYAAVITPYIAYESIDISPARHTFYPDIGILERDEFGDGGVAVTLEPAPLTTTALLPIPTRYANLEIRAIDGDVLITVIELLSPVNKREGDGVNAYEAKRAEIYQSPVNLLEIDLLRGGLRPRFAHPLPNYPYFIFLCRAKSFPRVETWPIALNAHIPQVPVPLRTPDPDIVLDIGGALRQVYANAHYERRIDYRGVPPGPLLSQEDAAWLDMHLRECGLRE